MANEKLKPLVDMLKKYGVEHFDVYQFFPDEQWERVRQHVVAEEAVKAFHHYATCVGARIGTTVRVIITDSGDLTCAEWQFGKGITFPKFGEQKCLT